MTTRKPVPLAQRVRASEARAKEAGARPTPRGLLPPDAAQALDLLFAAGYADSLTACIARALIEAADKGRFKGTGAVRKGRAN